MREQEHSGRLFEEKGWHHAACSRRICLAGLCLCVCPVGDKASGIWGFSVDCATVRHRAIPSSRLSVVILDGNPKTSDVVERGFRMNEYACSLQRSLTGTFCVKC